MDKGIVVSIQNIYKFVTDVMDTIIDKNNKDLEVSYMLIVSYKKGEKEKNGIPFESLVSCKGDATVIGGVALGVIKDFVRNIKSVDDKKDITNRIVNTSEEIARMKPIFLDEKRG